MVDFGKILHPRHHGLWGESCCIIGTVLFVGIFVSTVMTEFMMIMTLNPDWCYTYSCGGGSCVTRHDDNHCTIDSAMVDGCDAYYNVTLHSSRELQAAYATEKNKAAFFSVHNVNSSMPCWVSGQTVFLSEPQFSDRFWTTIGGAAAGCMVFLIPAAIFIVSFTDPAVGAHLMRKFLGTHTFVRDDSL